MAFQQYNNPLSVGNNGDFYAYQSNSNPIEDFKGLIQTIANEPAQIVQKQQDDEAQNEKLWNMYQPVQVPDWSFDHVAEMQKLVDSHNQDGTDLYAAGYNPFKSAAALLDPNNAAKFKRFHQTGNQLQQMSAIDKNLKEWWTNTTKAIAANPQLYAADALDQVNNFVKQPLANFVNGTAGMPPVIEKLQKPYDINAWMNKTRLATTVTQNGRTYERIPGAINDSVQFELANNPQAIPAWNKAFTELPQAKQQFYAAKAIANHIEGNTNGISGPAYEYALDYAQEHLLGKRVTPTPVGRSGATITQQKGQHRNDLINGVIQGDNNARNEFINSLKYRANMTGTPSFVHNSATGKDELRIPEIDRNNGANMPVTRTPAQVIVIDPNDSYNTQTALNGLLNESGTAGHVDNSYLKQSSHKSQHTATRGMFDNIH